MISSSNFSSLRVMLAIALVAATPVGWAQTASPSGADAAASDGLAEIVVIAEKRSARLQDVPIAITAVSGDELQARGILDSADLAQITPGFVSDRVGGISEPFLRGVGSGNPSAGDEPSVATYIDGFYQGIASAGMLPFNNIQQIEVLKGPQGTLYGRNATGGLVNIITRTPQSEFAVDGSIGYDNYEGKTANVYLTGAIAQGIDGDIAVTFRHQDEGYARDLLGGRDGVNDYTAVRSKLLFEFGGENSLIIGGTYADTNNDEGNLVSPFPGTVPLVHGPGVVYGQAPLEFAGSVKPEYLIIEYGVNATLHLDLGFANFVSLSQYFNVKGVNHLEQDGTSADGILAGTQLGLAPGAPLGSPLTPQVVAPFTFSVFQRQLVPYFITQELQLISKNPGPFSWIVGAYYQNDKDESNPLQLFYDVNLPPIGSFNAQQGTHAIAGYMQGAYHLDNGISLTGGARYSTEQKFLEGGFTSGGSFTPLYGSTDFNSFTYHVAIDDRINPALLVYATTSKGFKSGEFNALAFGAPPVKPEILYAYETGFKSDPTQYIRFNSSFYYYDYKDLQSFINSPAGLAILQNAANAKLYGADLELQVLPVKGLTIGANVGFEHAKYTDFANAQAFLPSPSGGEYPVTVDASDNRMIRAPELSGDLSVSYKFQLAEDQTLTLNGNESYMGNFYWDATNTERQGGYALLNASARYDFEGGRWNASIWGKNLTNKDYAIYRAGQQRFDGVAWAEPLTFGITLGAKF